jgi:hypothetical protein
MHTQDIDVIRNPQAVILALSHPRVCRPISRLVLVALAAAADEDGNVSINVYDLMKLVKVKNESTLSRMIADLNPHLISSPRIDVYKVFTCKITKSFGER